MDRSIPISFVCSYKLALIEPCRAKKHKNIMMAIMIEKMESTRPRVDLIDSYKSYWSITLTSSSLIAAYSFAMNSLRNVTSLGSFILMYTFFRII